VQYVDDITPRAPAVDQSYSVILLGVGLFLVAGAFMVKTGMQNGGEELAAARSFVSGNLLFVGLSALAAAMIRWLHLPIYRPVTVGVSILLALGFPVGTFVFWYWFAKVRPHELEYGSEAEGSSFRYTAGLYTAGLVLCLPVLVMQYVIGTSPPDGQELWEMLRLGFLVAALLLLMVGGIRSAKLKLSYYATLVLNVLLIIYFPLGTCFALVWFLAVKKHDRLIYLGS
jgi:hypothetical protein